VARGDDAGVGRGRIQTERVLRFNERDLMAVARDEVGGGHAGDAAAEDEDLHSKNPSRSGSSGSKKNSLVPVM
jgi:hypothetical protein